MVYLLFRLFPLGGNCGFDVSPDCDVAAIKSQLCALFPHVTISKIMVGGRVLADNKPIEFYRLQKESTLQCMTQARAADSGPALPAVRSKLDLEVLD